MRPLSLVSIIAALFLLTAAALAAELPPENTSAVSSETPTVAKRWGVRLSPMDLFFGIYGGDAHYSIGPSWDLGVSANWFRVNHTATGLTQTNAWQFGPSLIYYPGHTHSEDGIYIHGSLDFLPITVTTRDVPAHYFSWATGLLVGYGWINRWSMTFNLGAGVTFYNDDPAYKETNFGTLGNNNSHQGIQGAGEFTVGWLF